MKIICGVDEAGRGPLAGPVVAAAVILPTNHNIIGLNDSKKLTVKKRNIFFKQISHSAEVSIGIVSHRTIDKINILNATYLAMEKAILGLNTNPDLSLIDGYGLPNKSINNEGIIKGDSKIESISAASIIAKVTRDKLMHQIDPIFPIFKFDKHKGYGTKYHMDILKKYKATLIHRKSFAPVKNNLPAKDVHKDKKKSNQLSIQLASLDYVKNGYKVVKIMWDYNAYGRLNIIVKKNNDLRIVDISLTDNYPPPSEIKEILASFNKTILELNLDNNISIDIANININAPTVNIYHDIDK